MSDEERGAQAQRGEQEALLHELADFLRDGLALAATAQEDEQGEIVREVFITPPQSPGDPGRYSITVYHAINGADEEDTACTGTAEEALRFALEYFGPQYPRLRLERFELAPESETSAQEEERP